MIRDAYSVALDPLLPWWLIAGLVVVFLTLVGYALLRRARGALLRLLAGAALTAILLNPSLVEEQRAYQKDIAVVLVDRSPSQALGTRSQETNDALVEVRRQLALFPDLEVRVFEGGGGPDAAEKGTELMGVLQRGLADVPLRRLAGVITISDGQVHAYDATSGRETYGGGRYLWDSAKGADLGMNGDALVLDFNYAYHPSCVQDSIWSCPLAPQENWLPVPIDAGERMPESRR